MSGAVKSADGGLRRFRPYREYRDSGVPWVGHVPRDWKVLRNQFLFSVRKEVVGAEADDQLLSLTLKGVILRDVEEGKGKFPASFDTYQRMSPGDVVFCLFDIDETPRTVGIARDHGMVTGAYTVVRCREQVSPSFVTYYYESLDSGKQLRPLYSGLRKVIRPTTFLHAKMPAPSFAEQQAIAEFLDRETGKIDALVAKKERLIELLQEKRTALITHAVTRGLDPTAPTKPSGIDWLGDIPAHWEVLSLKFALSVPITDGPHETPEFADQGIPFLSAESVKNDRLDFSKKRGFISKEDHTRFSRKYRPRLGDVYMVKSGATTGNVARVETDQEFNIWSPLAAMRPKPGRLLTDFLFYSIKSKPFSKNVELSWSYGTQQNIGMGVISSLPLLLPPHDEQESIADTLADQTSEIDSLVDRVGDGIEALKEFRTALISAAVTGKIDVREEAA